MIKYAKAIWQLREFQKAFNSTCSDMPIKLSEEDAKLRNALFQEELREFITAKDRIEQADGLIDMAYICFGDLVSIGEYEHPMPMSSPTSINNALEKLSYLSFVTDINKDIVHSRFQLVMYLLCELGFNAVAGEMFDEVHRSNMSKLDENGQPIINDGVLDPSKPIGKILKSKHFSEPDLKSIIEKHAR